MRASQVEQTAHIVNLYDRIMVLFFLDLFCLFQQFLMDSYSFHIFISYDCVSASAVSNLKPLPEPMFTKISDHIWYNQATMS